MWRYCNLCDGLWSLSRLDGWKRDGTREHSLKNMCSRKNEGVDLGGGICGQGPEYWNLRFLKRISPRSKQYPGDDYEKTLTWEGGQDD